MICFITQLGKMAIGLVRVGKLRHRIVSSAGHLPPALGGLPKAPSRSGMFVPSARGGDAAYHGALLSATEVSQDGKAKKQSSRGRKQDRARVAGGQDYEVRYEARKTGKSAAAVKKVGNSRKRVERRLGR